VEQFVRSRSSQQGSVLDIVTATMSPEACIALRNLFSWPVVVDASAILDELRYRAGDAERVPALLVSARLGTARLLAKADHVAEVVREVPRVAAQKGRDADEMLAIFQADYLPLIRVVEVGDRRSLGISDPEIDRLSRRHPADVPSAVLTRLLDPAMLLTQDKDLLAGFDRWEEPAMPVTKWSAMAATTRDSGRMVMAVPVMQGAAIGAGAGALAVRELASSHPRIAAALLGVGVGVLAAAYQSPGWAERRERWAEQARSTITGVMDWLSPYADAANQLAAYRSKYPGLGSPVARIARVLALAPDSGLLLSDLRRILPDIAAEVRPTLESHDALFRRSRHRYRLGSPAVMPV
jgi:hypothetical protein